MIPAFEEWRWVDSKVNSKPFWTTQQVQDQPSPDETSFQESKQWDYSLVAQGPGFVLW